MKIGILSSQVTDRLNPLVTMAEVVDEAITAESHGFDHFWIVNSPWGMDAMTVASVAGQRTERIELGTAVVPAFPRHPVTMAQQAITTNMALNGRFTLGVGASHQPIMEDEYHVDFKKPARRMREYLEVLVPLCQGEHVDYSGEFFGANISLRPPGFCPVEVMVAAMGPLMLETTGALARGTLPWLVNAERLEQVILPTINAAAEAANKRAPRVAAILPVVATDDIGKTKELVHALLETGPKRESYEELKRQQGATSHADIAIIGNTSEVEADLGHLKAIGLTDFIAAPLRVDETSYERTCEVLAGLRSSLVESHDFR